MKKSIGAKDLIFPAPVLIIGTYDEEGRPNAMNVAWGGICSSNPPCYAISVREQRKTYANIMGRKAFTVNIPSERHVREADYLGIVSGYKADKFQAAGLTPVKSAHVDAPYIAEFPFNASCRLVDSIRIGQHWQLIGEIVDIQFDVDCMDDNGLPDICRIQPLIFDTSGNRYFGIGSPVEKAFSCGLQIGRER